MGRFGDAARQFFVEHSISGEEFDQAFRAAVDGADRHNVEDILDILEYSRKRIDALKTLLKEADDEQRKKELAGELEKEYRFLIGCLKKGAEIQDPTCTLRLIYMLMQYSHFCEEELQKMDVASDLQAEAVERIEQAVKDGIDKGDRLPLFYERLGQLSYFAAINIKDNKERSDVYLTRCINAFARADRSAFSNLLYVNAMQIKRDPATKADYIRALEKLESDVESLEGTNKGAAYAIIGEVYLKGIGRPVDREKGRYFLELARTLGNATAGKILESISEPAGNTVKSTGTYRNSNTGTANGPDERSTVRNIGTGAEKQAGSRSLYWSIGCLAAAIAGQWAAILVPLLGIIIAIVTFIISLVERRDAVKTGMFTAAMIISVASLLIAIMFLLAKKSA